jgi:hypothetical protein
MTLWDTADLAVSNRGQKALWVYVDPISLKTLFATGDVEDLPSTHYWYEISDRAAFGRIPSMTHGTHNGVVTWCDMSVTDAFGWSRDLWDVECLDCLRFNIEVLRKDAQDWQTEAASTKRELRRLRGHD